MSCLNDAQIQSIVDREAGDDVRQHVTSCARCQVRVRERETVMQGDRPGDEPASATCRLT